MRRKNSEKNRRKKLSARVVDLFCGIGGMTYGFKKEGFNVVAGVDIDGTCKYGYKKSNGAQFMEKDIGDVTAKELKNLFKSDKKCFKILIGCAPCQPYSKLNLKKPSSKEFLPLRKFAELISKVKPDVVSMENVKGLVKHSIFSEFVNVLREKKYWIQYKIVDASDYGVPQRRKRLVLLASKLGEINLIPKTHHNSRKRTVRKVIGRLEPIKHGTVSKKDWLHRARKLNDINKKRILSTPRDGGNMLNWEKELLLSCHKKKKGKSYRYSVYGRMRWDEPASTMTTQCVGIGNGRFGHPKQNRAISLREAALLQTFPKSYIFCDTKKGIVTAHIAKFIGNAVPVRLGRIIARSIKFHLAEFSKS